MLHQVYIEKKPWGVQFRHSSRLKLRPEMPIEIHKEENCSSLIHSDPMLHHGGWSEKRGKKRWGECGNVTL